MFKKFFKRFKKDPIAVNESCFVTDNLISTIQNLKRRGTPLVGETTYYKNVKLETYESDIVSMTVLLTKISKALKENKSFNVIKPLTDSSKLTEMTSTGWLHKDYIVNSNIHTDMDTFLDVALDLALRNEQLRNNIHRPDDTARSRLIKPYIITIDSIIKVIFLGVNKK